MNYRCADVLNNYKPPNYSVSLTHNTSKCNNAEDGDKCTYTCMGNPIDGHIQLDEQFVTLYDYSPDNSDNMLNYTKYTCKTSVKILLKFHGKLLKKSDGSKVTLNYNDGTTFKLITYTQQGDPLCALDIKASCKDEIDSVPIGTFTEEFYDVGLEPDPNENTHSSRYGGMIKCSNTTEAEDFATIVGKFRNQNVVDTSRYEHNLEYYNFQQISKLLGFSDDNNRILLSELVPKLKSMFHGKNINLHLLSCLVPDVELGATPFTETDIIPSEPLYTKSYKWIEEDRKDCEDLPVCSFEEQEGLDLSECNPGNPKSIEYYDRPHDNLPYQRVDLESSQCILECLPGYRKVILPNKTDNGNCYSYHHERLHTEYLNFDDGNLTRLGINCIPNSCATDRIQ
tara:strand:- start:93 stop:1283 length:1191 start_codon:yes stop_codon:yes gene_type:complete